MTFSKDGFLHFGDRVCFHNKITKSVLSCNINEKVLGMLEGYTAVGTSCCGPAIKNVFVLKRAEKDFFNDNSIHFG